MSTSADELLRQIARLEDEQRRIERDLAALRAQPDPNQHLVWRHEADLAMTKDHIADLWRQLEELDCRA